jgi:hypothetical protein
MKTAASGKARLYLVGAGISVDEPAGVASVPALLELLYSWIANGNAKLKKRLWAATSAPSTHNPFSSLRFETVVQTILEVEPRLRDVLPFMSKYGAPNAVHHFLAGEIADGAAVLTTNFDLLIERACRVRIPRFESFVLSKRHRVPPAGGGLIKLHGTFGTRELPRATLTGIGQLGLSFANFPEVREWLAALSEHRDLIVMGYSASDHFDVVPLIESVARSPRVFWTDYAPAASGAKWRKFSRALDTTIPPRDRFNFVDASLMGLMQKRDDRAVWRIETASCPIFLKALAKRGVGPRFPEPPANVAGKSTAKMNVEAMRQHLSEKRITLDQQQEAARMLLEEDPFGAYLGSHFEDEPDNDRWKTGPSVFDSTRKSVERYGLEGARARLLKRPATHGTARQRVRHFSDLYYIEDKRNDHLGCLRAAKGLVKAELDLGTYSPYRARELQLMMFEDIFDGAAHGRDLRAMNLLAGEVARLFRETGKIGAGVQSLIMLARVRHFETMNARDETRRAHSIVAGIDAARAATYFAVRSGRGDLIERGVWLYAFFLESAGERDVARETLTRFVDWISPKAVETAGVTLTNLALMCARAGDIRNAKIHLGRASRLSARQWPEKDVFLAVSNAQICAMAKRKSQARRWLAKAKSLVATKFPDDPWRHKEEIARLEDQFATL